MNEQGATDDQNDQAAESEQAYLAERDEQAGGRDQADIGEQRKRVSSLVWLGGLAAGLLVVLYLILAYMVGYDAGKRHGENAASTSQRAPHKPATSTPAVAGPGKELFASTCGSCHTLKAAGTKGEVGPNLDQLKPSMARVLAAIKNGGTGQGIMPVNVYTGQKAQQVAEFVSEAAGR